jgi:hypothetical protein
VNNGSLKDALKIGGRKGKGSLRSNFEFLLFVVVVVVGFKKILDSF